MILAQRKHGLKAPEMEKRVSKRLIIEPSQSTSSWVYPKECNLCKKYKIQHKGKSIFPKTITTKTAEETIKLAAEKNHVELYTEIQYLDLIAKEFKYHCAIKVLQRELTI